MENAVDALKIAFAVMVFTIALSVAMATFSQARETSEAVLYMNDKTNYYSYDEVGEATDMGDYIQYEITKTDGSPNITYTDKRIVGIEAIIPTLYRYYKENYFDLNSEIQANCPWVGTVNDIKKNLDLFLKGTSGLMPEDKSFGNTARFVTYDGFINTYKDYKFLEELGEYSTDRTYGINEEGNLEVINADHSKAILEQNASGTWTVVSGTLKNPTGTDLGAGPFSLQDIATSIGSSASTFLDLESGEIIELAKPTIKRVIKYTVQ